MVKMRLQIFGGALKGMEQLFCIGFATIAIVTALNDANDVKFLPEELHALKEIRENSELEGLLTEDYMKTDFYLIRFLREAKLDIENTLDLLDETKRWREEHNISNILKEDWSDMLTKFPIDFSSRDVTGRPVIQFVFGYWDVRYEIYNGEDGRLHRFTSYILERGTQEVLKVRAEGHTNVTRVVALVDANGMGMSQHFCFYCISVWTDWISNLQNHYPKIFDQAVLTNASFVLPLGLNIVWPFMSEESRGLLVTYSESDNASCIKYLDELIPADRRMPEFAGTKLPSGSLPGNASWGDNLDRDTRKRFYEEVSIGSVESVLVLGLILILISVVGVYIMRLRSNSRRRIAPGQSEVEEKLQTESVSCSNA